MRALARSRDGVRFARSLLLTDALPTGVASPKASMSCPSARSHSRDAYSEFVLKSLLPHVATATRAAHPVGRLRDQPGSVGSGVPRLRLHRREVVLARRRDARGQRRVLAALAPPARGAAGSPDRRWPTPRTRRSAARSGRCSSASTASASPTRRWPTGFRSRPPIRSASRSAFTACSISAAPLPPDEIAALAPQFSDTIARSPQLLQLLRNCNALGQWTAVDGDRHAHPRRGPRAHRGRSACWPTAEHQARGCARRGRPQRSLPLRQRQALQAVPWRTGRSRRNGGRDNASSRPRRRRARSRRARRAPARRPRRAPRAGIAAALGGGARAPARAALPRRRSSTSATDSTRRCRCSNAPRRQSRGAGVPQQPRPRARRGRPQRRGDRRVSPHARAEARPRGRVEQSRSRAAGGEPIARGDRRVSRGARAWRRISRRHTGTSPSRCCAHGEFAEGWREYEWRLRIARARQARAHATRVRAGTAAPGRD